MSLQVAAADDRARNRAFQESEIESEAQILQSAPTRVWFALTGRCNLACLHCPRIAGVSSDVDMEPELFRRVRDEIMVNAEEVDFGGNNLGEQMIHPDFYTALADIRAAGCKVLLTTNGTKLNEESATALAKEGVRLRISVEGTGSTYEQVRRVSWDKLMGGLRSFQQAAHDYPDAHATLEFAITLFADNLHQLPELVATAKELGADRVFAHHLLPKNEDQKLQSLFFHRKAANDTFAKTEQLASALGVELSLPAPMDCGSLSLKKPAEPAAEPKPTGPAPCYLPWTSVNILENGDVLPCCVAGSSLIMGNLKRNSFREIWNGPAYQKLRKTVNSKRPHPTCATCSMRGGATEDTYDILLNQHSVTEWVQSSVKQYLVRTKRKKTLARLVYARDTMQRLLSRV